MTEAIQTEQKGMRAAIRCHLSFSIQYQKNDNLTLTAKEIHSQFLQTRSSDIDLKLKSPQIAKHTGLAAK